MLIELLVSVTIVLALLGAVFSLVDPSGGTLAVQSLTADLHQRQRGVLAELHRHLLLAGSGPHPGMNGVVAHLRPAVAPALRGAAGRSLAGVGPCLRAVHAARRDGRAAGERFSSATPAAIGLLPAAACALPCGLSDRGGGLALVFDATGRSDLYRVLSLTGATALLEHVGGGAPAYAAGAFITPVVIRGFHHDRGAEQLRVHNGAGSDLPFVDGVVAFAVRYFGIAQPVLPPAAGPAAVTAPCLRAAGVAAPPASGIGALDLALFSDDSSCGGGHAVRRRPVSDQARTDRPDVAGGGCCVEAAGDRTTVDAGPQRRDP